MSNDYTLPPVPEGEYEHESTRGVKFHTHSEIQVLTYGHACRAPLLARIAALEAEVSEQGYVIEKTTRLLAETVLILRGPEPPLVKWSYHDIPQLVQALSNHRDRLRAEVESLRSALTVCADDLEAEVNARASGELPRRIERDLEPVRKARALLAQPAGTWVNPLAAEVEKLRAKIDRAEVSYGNMLRADDKRPDGTTEYTRGWGDCLRAIAARKGEGSEG